MTTGLLRITIGAPIAIIALLVFTGALLAEWIGDLMRTCPDSEKSQ